MPTKLLLPVCLVAVSGTLPHTTIGSEHAVTNSLGMKLVSIPAGSFEMGNPDPEIDEWDESPVHSVTFERPFFMAEEEVTLAQFQAFRPDFSGSQRNPPYVTGLSWHDAMAFCQWLSEKEGKPYRLPTEAEWEYAARAGSDTVFWSGDQPPKPGSPNPWGLKNVHGGPMEWCLDWYGPYAKDQDRNSPGRATGLAKVIRGGSPEETQSGTTRSRSRAGYAPGFRVGPHPQSQDPGTVDPQADPELTDNTGLVGLWYEMLNLRNPEGFDWVKTLEMSWVAQEKNLKPGDEFRDVRWSAQWEGRLIGPIDGDVTFRLSSDSGASFNFQDGEMLLEGQDTPFDRTVTVALEKGKSYPIQLTYSHDSTDESYFSLRWSWEGQPEVPITQGYLRHDPEQREQFMRLLPPEVPSGEHPIGFRVVQAPMPSSPPLPAPAPFLKSAVLQTQPAVKQGPDPDRPWYRRRAALPIPPDNTLREINRALGFHPALMAYSHAPALGVMPNGDLLMAFFSSYLRPGGENISEKALFGTRLRYGADQWDMPGLFLDMPRFSDVSPALFVEDQRVFFFWGNSRLPSRYPFLWIESTDSGASWSEPRIPVMEGQPGPFSSSPKQSIFRGGDGALYVPTDGDGSNTLLWRSRNGVQWKDTGGRTFGRHSAFVELRDGRFLAMGGKRASMGGYMPLNRSADRGKSWSWEPSVFPALGGGQRPALLRLKSGRLFFCGDFQNGSSWEAIGEAPEAMKMRGCFVALSEDEGQTWHVKKLVGTVPSEKNGIYHTLGYAAAAQAPNGIIHVVTSVTKPNLHFELNEAWILSPEAGWDEYDYPEVSDVQTYETRYPGGSLQARWSGGTTATGEWLLEGRQVTFHENGKMEWEATWAAGRKTGEEHFWDRDGRLVWKWRHLPNDKGIWTRYFENGEVSHQSEWFKHRLHGHARAWSPGGALIFERDFRMGTAVQP